MFWEIFSELCRQKNVKPSAVSKAIGLSDVIPTKWKQGALPKAEILIKLSEYFNCTVDYLLTGKSSNIGSDYVTTIDPKYTEHYVAFLDILGFSNYVKKDNVSFCDVNKIYEIFNEIKIKNSKVSQGPAFTTNQMSKLKFNSISDTIVISIPKSEERALEILVFAVSTMIFNILLECKLLLRGAISEGDFFSDNNTNCLFGPALIDAAILEKNLAVYPRIVILPQVVANYEKDLSDDNKGKIAELIKLEQIENDSLYIVNYVKYILERLALDDAITKRRKLDEFVDLAEKELYCIDNISIRKKWLYFRDYLNSEIDASQKSKYYHYQCPKINVENIFDNHLQENIVQTASVKHPKHDEDIVTSRKKSSPSELSEEEQECLSVFRELTRDDQMKYIGRMQATAEQYTPEMKENA